MKDIIIFGAGGLGREVQWLIERINSSKKKNGDPDHWNIKGYADDKTKIGTNVSGYEVIGTAKDLLLIKEPMSLVCAVGASVARESIIGKLRQNPHLLFPNLIDPSVIMSDSVEIGEGNIICAGNILTINIKIENFCILNLACTVGHDARIRSFTTLYPNCNISGNVEIRRCTEIGTGSQIIQGKTVGERVIIGANSMVNCDLQNCCTAVGSPCRPIKVNGVAIRNGL